MENLSVLVCTRNRSQMCVRLLRSLLIEKEPLEIVIVDQSDNEETRDAIAALGPDPRLRYLRSARAGKGAALNQGIEASTSEIIVCTDDDCEAAPGWVPAMTAALAGVPSAALAFCRVVAAPFDATEGYIPTFEIVRTRTIRSVTSVLTHPGIGAGMALRRADILKMGGFDEAFGPGAHFRACDDWDIAVRALLLGFHIVEVAELSIVHHGFRTFAEGREHARRDWLGIGAVFAKYLRARRISTTPLAAWTLFHDAILPPFVDAAHLRRPRGFVRITSFMEGFARALRTPVDPATLVFTRDPKADSPS